MTVVGTTGRTEFDSDSGVWRRFRARGRWPIKANFRVCAVVALA